MKNKLISLLAVLILVSPTFLFFFSDKFYTFHDEVQVGNLFHYFKAIGSGQFPPRWASEMHFTYGSPFLLFNYQLPYYLGYLFIKFGASLVTTFKLLMAISVIAGATGMFFLGEFLTGSILLSVFAAVLYSYTPYQAVIHFVRGTPGEAFALALFPWIFLAAFALIKKSSFQRTILFALSLALLLLSHQPASLFALPFLFLIFVLPLLLTRNYKEAFSFLKSFLLAMLLSAFYIIPVLSEKGLIGSTGPFNYIDHFPFIRQLIYSAWSYQGSNPFSSDTMSFQIGLINLAILAFALLIAIGMLLKKTKDKLFKYIYLALLFCTLLVIFLMNIRSDFFWRVIPLVQSIQFPWRLLMFTTLFTPILFLFFAREMKSKWFFYLVVILLLLGIGINVGYFRPGLITNRGDEYYLRRLLPTAMLLPGETVSADYLDQAEDYAPLPKGAIRPKSLPEQKLTADLPTTEINIRNDSPYRIQAEIAASANSVITFHTFLYPGWAVSVDGALTPLKADEIGAITFGLTPGVHEVVISFSDTPIRRLSNIISLGTLAFIGISLIRRKK